MSEQNALADSGQTAINVNDQSIPNEGFSTQIDINTPGTDGASSTFLDSLPENLRSEKSLEGVKSVEDLANQFLNAQKLIGKKTIGLPSEDSTPEQIEDFYSRLRPKTSDSYEFDNSVLPEGFERSEEEAKAVKDIFYKAGLSAHQAKIVQSEYEKLMLSKEPSKEEQEAAFEAKGKKVLGDKYQEIMETATKFSRDYIPESARELAANLDNEAMLVVASMIHGIKGKASEDNAGLNAGAGSQVMTDNERRERAGQLLAEMQKLGSLHPRYEELNKQRQALYR